MMTPDYNDGRWHGWNGGECPVHPKSVVEICTRGSGAPMDRMPKEASGWAWTVSGSELADIVAFRVVTPYREPREGYAVVLFPTAREAKTAHPGSTPIFVREVTE